MVSCILHVRPVKPPEAKSLEEDMEEEEEEEEESQCEDSLDEADSDSGDDVNSDSDKESDSDITITVPSLKEWSSHPKVTNASSSTVPITPSETRSTSPSEAAAFGPSSQSPIYTPVSRRIHTLTLDSDEEVMSAGAESIHDMKEQRKQDSPTKRGRASALSSDSSSPSSSSESDVEQSPSKRSRVGLQQVTARQTHATFRIDDIDSD